MKKTFKIATVLLLVFALVSNIYTSLFSFYGMKTNNLPGAVWANAISETTGSSGDGSSSSGTSSNGTSSSGAWFNLPKNTAIWCGTITYTTGYTGNATAGATGTMTAPNGSVSASIGGGYVNSTSTSGTIAAHWGEEIRCTGPIAFTWCSNVTGIAACQ